MHPLTKSKCLTLVMNSRLMEASIQRANWRYCDSVDSRVEVASWPAAAACLCGGATRVLVVPPQRHVRRHATPSTWHC